MYQETSTATKEYQCVLAENVLALNVHTPRAVMYWFRSKHISWL